MDDTAEFIDGYTSKDVSRIRFAWNGKHGDEFVDSNHEFRKEVMEIALLDLERVDLLLIRDLYRAETEYSKEAWGVDRRVGQLGEALLRRGANEYLEDYLIGKLQSFDASLGAAAFDIDHELACSLIHAVEERLKHTSDEEEEKLLEYGRETFERWVDGTRPKDQ